MPPKGSGVLARHAAPRNNRRRWYSLATVLLIAVVTAVVVIVASPGGSSSSNRTAATSASPSPTPTPTTTCTDHPTLNVVAASGIADVVRDVASHTCLQATVTATDDSAAAAKMLKQGKADVWIPDSRVRAILAGTAACHSGAQHCLQPDHRRRRFQPEHEQVRQDAVDVVEHAAPQHALPVEGRGAEHRDLRHGAGPRVGAEFPGTQGNRRQVPRPRVDGGRLRDHGLRRPPMRFLPARCASRRPASSLSSPARKSSTSAAAIRSSTTHGWLRPPPRPTVKAQALSC